jgi:murein DD-endopeptidase MepM/ murein hydrolase activator NlpD
MQNAGVPQAIIGNFINIFAYTVNFRSDIKPGNTFKVIYDRKVAPNGKVVKNGDVLYAELNLSKEKIQLYRYKDSAGGIDYYNAKGEVLKRTLDRKPMEFRAARISSRFGWRRHPILNRRIFHSGVDYAAPQGTRIYASADGTIQRSQWVNGYGKYVVIRHNSEYSTGYAHMSAFARGIRPGVRVKQGQVIGYVGSTGRSTGPHLHFEIVKNGTKVDPLKIKAATGVSLYGKELARFKSEMKKISLKGKI